MSGTGIKAATLGWALAALLCVAGCAAESDPTNPGQDPVTPDPPPGDPPPALSLTAEPRFGGLQSPVLLTHGHGDPRTFIVEQPGRIRVVSASGQLRDDPYLDITSLVGFGGERGLLSAAFHPDFTDNGRVFVSYTDQAGTSRVVRYTEAADGQSLMPSSAVEVLSQTQPFGNHNGGHLAFGPDGFLYFALGDGGSSGDPLDSGQDTRTWLGSILRVDVDRTGPGYDVPADNPFIGDPGGADEIWAHGLRNPWRFSFDPGDNRIYIGDVGQNAREEVSAVAVAPVGYNFGWRLKEGDSCFASSPCDEPGLTDPVLDYSNPGQGCSVTGGYVYRGQAIPELVGTYLYSDFCAGWIKGFRLVGDQPTERTTWIDDVGNVTSFGVDADGELYVTTSRGDVLQIVAR
jgi:glucose/arabinose dehydrogenase